MFKGRWDDCIRTLKRHLEMPTALWADERAASMRYIARCYKEKGERQQARNWYFQAIAQAPHLREPYMDLAQLLYDDQNWDGVLYFTGCALSITQRPRTYICEVAAWSSLPHDLRTIALFRTGRIRESLEEARQALAMEPESPRFQGNVELLERLAEQA